MGAAVRVVLDTNVLLSLFVFADSRYAPLRGRLESGEWRALTDQRCLHEFQRVLAYPMFSLDAAGQQARFDRLHGTGDARRHKARSGARTAPCARIRTTRSSSNSHATAAPTGWSPPTRRC